MKKNLLLTVALMGASAFAMAQTDITPSGYKWNETGVVPTISTVAFKGSNPTVPAFSTFNGESEYNQGLIGVDGPPNGNLNFESVKAGLSIVDFGGTVGKVLAIRGAACNNVETDLQTATGREITVAKMSAATTWFDLNFFTDPNNTPTSSQAGTELATDNYIHVKLVFNLYTDDQTSTQESNTEAANITNILCPNNANGIKPQGGATGGSIYAYNFFKVETEGEYAGQAAYDEEGKAQWDATRWMVYEFDTWCPKADDENTYAPLRVKLSFNGWANFSTETLFIKELSFTKCSGTPEMDCYTAASKTYETLTIGEATGIQDVDTAVKVQDSPKYNLAGQRVSDSYKGVVIQNSKKYVVR